MRYKVSFDYDVWNVVGFTLLNSLLLIVTFGLGTPFVILNFIKLITKGLEISEINYSNHELKEPKVPGKML